MQQTQIKKKKKVGKTERFVGQVYFMRERSRLDVGFFDLAAGKHSNEPVPFYCCRR